MWTKEAWFGRAAAKQITDNTFVLPRRVARVWCIRPFGGTSFMMPDATQLPIGWSVLIFNDNIVTSLGINDNDDVLIVGIGSAGFAEMYLEDNSTAAGVWRYRTGAPPVGSFSGYTGLDHVVSFGGDSGADIDDHEVYDIVEDTWSLDTSGPGSMYLSAAVALGAVCYIHQTANFWEYTYPGAFVAKTSPTNSNSAQGVVEIASKVIAYHRGLTTVEEYTPGTNSWAALSWFFTQTPVDLDDILRNIAVAQDDAVTPDEAYILAGENSDLLGQLYRHDRSSDTYSKLTAPAKNNYRRPFMWPGGTERVHVAGGTLGDAAPSRFLHQWYDSAGDTGWTQATSLPSAVQGGGCTQTPSQAERANLGMGAWEDSPATEHWEYNHVTEAFRALATPSTSHEGQENSWATASQ